MCLFRPLDNGGNSLLALKKTYDYLFVPKNFEVLALVCNFYALLGIVDVK
jgi:hypothetical protein